MSADQVLFIMAMAATISFAITGVLSIAERRVDFFSAVVLGVITAIGGGTIRDLILDVPVFWAADLSYVRFAVLASILTFVAQAFFSRPQVFKLILYIDGLGIALFGVAGAVKTADLGFGWPIGPLMLGVITAIGGSLIRDVLSGRKTLLMTDEVYAVPVVIGCLVTLVTLKFYPNLKSEGMIAGTVIAFSLRAAAIHWSLRLPSLFTMRPRDK
jgi:uncharacterized membrane protein YeiH